MRDQDQLLVLENRLEEAYERQTQADHDVWILQDEVDALRRRIDPPSPPTEEERALLGGATRLLFEPLNRPMPTTLADIISPLGAET